MWSRTALCCTGGVWDKAGAVSLSVGSPGHPVNKMVVVADKLWCATANTIRILAPDTLELEGRVEVGGEEDRAILAMVEAGLGVWVAQQGSATIRLLHTLTRASLAELSLVGPVARMLGGSDEIIRQHKTACLRVTALLPVKDKLWVGTRFSYYIKRT